MKTRSMEIYLMHSIDDASVALPIRCVYNVCHEKSYEGSCTQ